MLKKEKLIQDSRKRRMRDEAPNGEVSASRNEERNVNHDGFDVKQND